MKIGDKVTHKALEGSGQVTGIVEYPDDLVWVEWSTRTDQSLHHVDDLNLLEPTDLERYLERLDELGVDYERKAYGHGTLVLLDCDYIPDGRRLGCEFTSDGSLFGGFLVKCD